MSNELKKGSSPKSAPHQGARGAGHAADVEGDLKERAKDAAGGIKDAAESIKDKAQKIQDGASETYRKATDYTRDGYERASTWASDRYDGAARTTEKVRKRSSSEFERVRKSAEDLVTHTPVMIGLAGLAAGLLVGALLPRTQRENEAFGRLSDELRDQGKRYALDLVREGKERVVSALDPAAGQDSAS